MINNNQHVINIQLHENKRNIIKAYNINATFILTPFVANLKHVQIKVLVPFPCILL